MSFEATAWAWSAQTHAAGNKSVLLDLADNADLAGFVKRRRSAICERCSLAPMYLAGALRHLALCGHIAIVQETSESVTAVLTGHIRERYPQGLPRDLFEELESRLGADAAALNIEVAP